MRLTITDAAKSLDVSRTTIYSKIKAGELTRHADGKVDVSDLIRLFGPLIALPEGKPSESPSPDDQVAQAQQQWFQDLIDQQAETIARQAAQIEKHSAELAAKDKTLTDLMDNVQKLLPPPEAHREPVKRGFFRYIFG